MARPNFIIFVTDDQGYGDLSCMGSPDVRTPHVDRLAAEGARCTSWYSNSPVCSPSRASLLSGRYPGHAGVRQILAGHRTATGLPNTVATLPSVLHGLGYSTWMAGKWHLGTATHCRPEAHGFDHWFGFLAGCIDYYSHIFYWGMNKPGPAVNPIHDLWEDGREVWQNGDYFTEVVTGKAIDYLRRAAGDDRPFLLYVPYNAPHYPMHAPKEYLDRFPHLPPDRRIMAAMLSAFDDGVGEIMAEVGRLGLADRTCTFFVSDNGPSRESRNWLDGNLDHYYGGSTGGFRGHKFSLFEGGVRVPAVMHWPGRIPGGRVLDGPCASMDVMPTLLAAAGASTSGLEFDGVDLLPYLTGEASAPPQRDIFWEMGDQTAVRRGRWKLVLNGQLVEGAPPEDAVHLADLDADPGERTNLKDRHPDLTADLTRAAQAWRADLEQRWTRDFSVDRQGTVTR